MDHPSNLQEETTRRLSMLSKVTIGIPTLNRSKLLLRAVHSVLAQTYANIELIVSDDASTDDTLARIAEISDSRLVLFQRESRVGLVANFDFCLRNATGEFFLLLGDDDLLLPDAIASLVEPFLGPRDVGMAWCSCRIADADSDQLWTTDAGPALESPANMLSALWGGERGPRLSGILLRTSEAIQEGGYRARYGDLCDIGLWAAVALPHQWIACISEPLVQYTNHHGSTTSCSAVSQWREWARLVHTDLLDRSDPSSQKILRAAKSKFISSITLTVLMQTIGKNGWVSNAVREVIRSPGSLLTPYVAGRVLKQGWKILMLARKARTSNA